MELTTIEAEASEIAELADEIAVEQHTDDVRYWSVWVPEGAHGAYYGAVDGEVIQELAESYDVYGVTVYHRDGTPWN